MRFYKISILLLIMSFTTSCATIFSGELDPCQTKKPDLGQPKRSLRLIFMIVNIPVVGHIVDFSTGAIYQPCTLPKGTTEPLMEPAIESPNN